MTLRFRLSWFFLFFFFSSRRRHTRCSRDWSSDVCSSDLVTRPLTLAGPGLVASRSARVSGASWARTVATAPERGGATTSSSYTPATASSARTTNRAVRSEEHTSELQSRLHLVCRLLLEKKKKHARCDACLHVHA